MNNLSITRQYIPFSLLQLQRLIDLGRVNTNEPIDLTQILNSKVIMLNPSRKEYGIHLTDEVSYYFKCLFF